MNKLTKGAIAGGAGIILLLGGAGTFALWSNSTGVDGGSIESGTLTIAADGTPVWTDISPDVTPVVVDSSFLIVPGDVVTYSQDFTIDATGNNLLANFSYNYANGTLPTGVTAVATASVNGGTAVTGPVAVDDNDSVSVVITVTFAGSTTGTTSQGVAVDLAGFTATVTQVRPTP